MLPKRRSPYTVMTVLLMWLLPMCTVISSGLELLVIPGNAPKISKRWDHNGENNSISAEREVHHIPPGQRSSAQHQVISVVAIAPPKKPEPAVPAFLADGRARIPYRGKFPLSPYTEIPVPPPEMVC